MYPPTTHAGIITDLEAHLEEVQTASQQVQATLEAFQANLQEISALLPTSQTAPLGPGQVGGALEDPGGLGGAPPPEGGLVQTLGVAGRGKKRLRVAPVVAAAG